ncbi:MAG TPA: DUF4395 domain-containing protein [Mycobacteriales bacterium]|nr:DUF4395 domain-containing protein [Mycobacteriales bacterium]
MSSSLIDPRGPRLAAAVTSVVLALVLLLSSRPGVAGGLLALQALVFLLGSRGRSPYTAFYRRVVRPRLQPPAELEDPRPPQFAQLVGLAFAGSGVVAFALGATAAALVLTSFALVAALLNASIGLCLGCEVYLLIRRFFPTDRGVTA